MNPFRSRIAAAPKASLIVGKAVFLVGALLIVTALFGRISLGGLNEQRAQQHLPPFTKLAEAYPQYPTWLVPEGPVGSTVSAVLVLVGMFITVVAVEVLEKDKRRGGR